MRHLGRNLGVVVAMAFCGLLLSACGDSGGSDPCANIAGCVTIGTGGGTVSLPSGPTVAVPAGALPANTTITVAASTSAAPAGAVSALYQFGPAGTTFTNPVTVSFPVPAGTTAANAAIYWTKLGSTTEWDILPTTVSGTTASASVSHFSLGFVGAITALDISGTWANAALNQTLTPPGGSPGAAPSLAHSRDLVQTGSAFTYTAVNGSGFRATCTGTIAGTSVVATCDATSLDGTCTSHYTQTGTVIPGSPMTMTTDSTLVLGGASCAGVGYAYHVTGTLTRQATPILDVSGTYSVTINFTRTGPGLPSQSGTSQGTRVRTQTGSSGSSTMTTATTTYNCRGPIIGNVVYDGCSGLVTSGASSGAIYSGTGVLTVSVGPPMTMAGSGTYAIRSDPAGYTQITWTATATGGAAFCVSGLACTPAGTPDVCKTYATACDVAGNQTCVVAANKPNGTTCGGVNYCAAGVCARTVSGAFEVTHWPDSGVKTTVVGPPAGNEVVTKVLVPNGSAAGYAVFPVTQGIDGTFSATAVPVGPYYLQVETPTYPIVGGVQVLVMAPSLEPFTTSAPRFGTVRGSRPDIVRATVPTITTLNVTNMTPWAQSITSGWLLLSSSQADVEVFATVGKPKPLLGATSYSVTLDWSDIAGFNSGAGRGGLPSAAQGDVLYVFQRQSQTIGSGASTATSTFPTAFARLTSYPAIVDGGTATLDVSLAPAPTATMASNLKPSAFDALMAEMAPGGHSDLTNFSTGLNCNIWAVPHTVLGPDMPSGPVVRLGWILTNPGTPDTDYGAVLYGDFLDPLWKQWRQILYSGVAPVAAPGATPVDARIVVYAQEALSPAPPNPVVPVLGPVQAPRIAGLDATSNIATGVGLQPVISWSPPTLGTANVYYVSIHELLNEGGVTNMASVFSATLYGDLSFKVPPGFLKAGSTYLAYISAQNSPWKVLDGNPTGWGTPTYRTDRLTGSFTP